MKRTLAAILIALLLLFLCLTACTEETEPETYTNGDYIYILLDDGTAEITKYKGNDENLIIPDALEGYTVTSIGNYSFSRCSSLTSVTIPDSVGRLGVNPFACCENLLKVIVSPDHPALAVIDGVLFSKQSKCLICYPVGKQEAEYMIPSGIHIIGDDAFCLCPSLTSVFIPDSVATIGNEAFGGCSSLASITIPDSVTTIGNSAFSGCSSLISIVIPSSIVAIEKQTFSYCSALTSIAIPGNVSTIGDDAFLWCSSLDSITIPDSVTVIGTGGFFGCSRLTSIVIPDSVTAIGIGAFYGCSSLTLTVGRDSYAAQYCKENNLNYTYPDSLGWLNN